MTDQITILISHDNRDERIATEIKLFLEEVFLNVHVYVSGKDLIGGQTWIEEIKNRLISSHIIISLLTLKSLSNNWVYFESGAGFVDDKTIPLLTDNLKLSDLKPPLSLLQARMLSIAGIEALMKDISKKLNQREPRNYPGLRELVDKVEKLLRNESTLLLKEKVDKRTFAPNAISQWIYEDNCLVFDYLIKGEYKIAVDTYFYIDKTEIQLLGRKGAEEFIINTMCKTKDFLPKSFDEYELKGSRLIFQRFESNEKIECVEKALIDILNRIENYESGNPAVARIEAEFM